MKSSESATLLEPSFSARHRQHDRAGLDWTLHAGFPAPRPNRWLRLCAGLRPLT